MKCIYCGKSVMERPLERTKPTGQSDAGWACMPCIEEKEPELAKNIKAERSDIEDDLNYIFYP